MGPSADYINRIRRDFRVLDALPRPVRLLVHEFGAKRVVAAYQRGLDASRIRQSFEDADILDVF